ncbi:ATP-dependent DNA helicase [Methylococcus mesophilus]|uniref:ATP-dependent DNA helicase n=1 Tax=Methylococcus mesophilus TaxID=2993564 RepID=UPI00224AA4A7|nr:ATP-dependent DNA helicase [Methylococcus mesophilus]UZR30109.1 ATP-dependent DNA helicase [Methylococcus mesophilus]
MSSVDDAFAEDGPLARSLTGFRPREAQTGMARAVEQAIRDGRCLIAEAGTGTGKTFAYLVPALLSGKRVLVSTGTRNLQDQLFQKDLPLLRQALAVPVRTALLKGRSNYLCPYRLENVVDFGFRAGFSAEEADQLERIRRWAKTTRSGDVAEVSDVPEASLLWRSVTSTAENCLGQDCGAYEDCHVVQARKAAQEAQITVINHHLLWADWAVKTDGFGELLPEADVIIVDEAHQFAETATQFLGISLSTRQLGELADDTLIERAKDAPDMGGLADSATLLKNELAAMRAALGEELRRDAWHSVAGHEAVNTGLRRMEESLLALAAQLKLASVRGKGLESCWKRCDEFIQRLEAFLAEDTEESVRWFETHRRGFSLSRTPLDIAGEFARFRKARQATWIFTSATLSVSGRFEHFSRQLGIADAECRRWESPFDYRRQSLLYLPAGLPEPGTRDYTRAVLRAAYPVLKASGGRAFLLFTSHQALAEAASILEGKIEFPLFVQGTQPKARLLEAFRASGNGLLLGTASFWEGVDVRGEALSCVVIDKLPFASPGDPVISARLEAIRKRGHSPFAAFQLPAAVITLKQGAGRLIRDVDDRGVLVLADPRLTSKSYGRVFLDSLPPMRITRESNAVRAFFAGPQPEVSP